MLGALKAAGAAGLVDAVLGVAPHGAAAALGLVAFFIGADRSGVAHQPAGLMRQR
jgi:hypothetical protein